MIRQQMLTLVNYMLQTGETPNAESFIRELAQRVPQYEEELMTIAQQLEQKGELRGEQRGAQRGAREALLKVAQNMLDNGFDWASVMKMTGLTEQDRQHIKH